MSKKGTVFGIIAALLLGIMVPFAVAIIDNFVNPSSSEPIEDYIPLDPEFLEKPTDGSLPKDHTAYDNYRIAGGVLSLTENFRTEQTGNAISEMVIENNQVVKAERIVNGDIAYATYLTTSSFVNSTNQRLYLEDKVLIREGKVENKEAIYNSNIEPFSYSYEYIYENLGWVPFEMSSYIINEDTIVSSRVVEDSSYPYIMEFILDNKNSINNTKREVRYNANAISYPKYEQVKVTISLDNDWRVLEIKTDDIYDITVKMGISMTAPVNSKLVEKFYYDDYLISSLDSYSYFSQYLDSEVNDEAEVIKEKSALDYLLDVAFDVILNGSTFNVTMNTNDTEIKGKIDVKFDILNMTGNVIGLFDDFYFKYDGDLYLSYLKYNYKFDSNFLQYLLNVINDGLIETTSTIETYSDEEIVEEENALTKLVEDLVLTKDENNVSVSGTYEGFTFTFNFFEIEQGTILRNIVLSGTYEGEEFEVLLVTTSSKIEYEEKEYNDLSSSTWLIDECLEILTYEGYTLHLDYLLETYDLDINVNIKDDKVLLVFNITDENDEKVSIELFYIEEKFYLELENYIIEVGQEDVELLISYISQYLEENQESSENTENDSVQETTQEDIDQQEILDLIYEVVDEVSMIDDDHINISLLLSKIDENLSDTNVIISLEDENLKLYFDAYEIDMLVYEYNSNISLPVGKDIYTKDVVDTVLTHYSNIESLWNKDTIQLDINDVIISSSEGDIYLEGEYTKNGDAYQLELEFSNQIKMKLRIIYLNEKYYLSLGEDSYSVNLILNEKQMETFMDSIDTIVDYILGENDFDASMEEFISRFVDEILAILSGESLDMSIGEFIFELTKIVDSSYLEIDERNIILEFDESKLQLFNLHENYYILVLEGINYDESSIQGDIELKEREYVISIDSTGFIDISTIFKDLGIQSSPEQVGNES